MNILTQTLLRNRIYGLLKFSLHCQKLPGSSSFNTIDSGLYCLHSCFNKLASELLYSLLGGGCDVTSDLTLTSKLS